MQLSDEQINVIEHIKSESNICLTGGAGTGKTTVIHYIKQMCNNTGLRVKILAPSGISALNVAGQTIHSGLKIEPKPHGPEVKIIGNIMSILKEVDLLIIDEIGSVRHDIANLIFEHILEEGKKGHIIQVIVVGDWFQIGPIIDKKQKNAMQHAWGSLYHQGYAFLAPNWPLMHFDYFDLKEVIRQSDVEFTKFANELRIYNANKDVLNYFKHLFD